ncbi:MAG: DEAD/DEAH box helicase [Alphaproteobacteria bacterium]|nr:DEAD/DEAH box helicase [Alphaproteobacteria bacterium]
MQSLDFTGFGLSGPLLRALKTQNFNTPTPIQAAAIPGIMSGRDLLGLAQTGTGKTAAFALPILQSLSLAEKQKRPVVRALIVAPTRELALQIDEHIRLLSRHLGLRSTTIYGGVGRKPQIDKLAGGVDIVTGTPGRIVDLMTCGHLKLQSVTHFVLDEADHMFDLGFVKDIKKIISALPKKRQSLMFSATMPTEVAGLAASVLDNPLRVEVPRSEADNPQIEQKVFFVNTGDKRTLLKTLLNDPALSRAIVFTRTKHAAGRIAEGLCKDGTDAEALHGNKSQSARQHSLARFRSGKARILVATDVAARGIDVTGVTHVINFDLPNVPECYVHRIGRTARAGNSGIAVSFCDDSEMGHLRSIEKLTGNRLIVAGGTPRENPAPASRKPGNRPKQKNRFKPRYNERARPAA